MPAREAGAHAVRGGTGRGRGCWGAASQARGRRGRMVAVAVHGLPRCREEDKGRKEIRLGIGGPLTRACGVRGPRGCRTRALSHGRLLLSHYHKKLLSFSGP